MNVSGKNWWVHVTCNDKLTYLTVHRSLGYVGIGAAGFLTQYKGISVSDCWKAYDIFDQLSGHGRCCAHILRELQKVMYTHQELAWAKHLKQTLLDMKTAKKLLLGRVMEVIGSVRC